MFGILMVHGNNSPWLTYQDGCFVRRQLGDAAANEPPLRA
jgi:hypothetical protein